MCKCKISKNWTLVFKKLFLVDKCQFCNNKRSKVTWVFDLIVWYKFINITIRVFLLFQTFEFLWIKLTLTILKGKRSCRLWLGCTIHVWKWPNKSIKQLFLNKKFNFYIHKWLKVKIYLVRTMLLTGQTVSKMLFCIS